MRDYERNLMGLQTINEQIGYVVEFEELPELPVTGHHYEKPYAEALTDAIEHGVITEGGKYFIHFTDLVGQWARYEVAKVTD